MSVFSANVRRYRQEAGLTLARFAGKLGLPVATVTTWEIHGVKQPRTPLGPIAAVLGVTVAQLMEAPEDCGGVCEVYRITHRQPCGQSPALPFRAGCACGHVMTGLACDACFGSKAPGCLTCWEEKRHRCAVSVVAAELAVPA